MFVYRGMPDMYTYRLNGESYWVFYHEGEFYLHDRNWVRKGLSEAEEFRYFDTAEEVLQAMLKIGAFKDWKREPDALERLEQDVRAAGEELSISKEEIEKEVERQLSSWS